MIQWDKETELAVEELSKWSPGWMNAYWGLVAGHEAEERRALLLANGWIEEEVDSDAVDF